MVATDKNIQPLYTESERGSMKYFQCCYKCVAPKRHPGCASDCPEYKESRNQFDAEKAQVKKAKDAYNDYLSVRRGASPGRFKG